MRSFWVLVPLLAILSAAPTARAGGFDTPILYSARHIGMGGTAVASVDDASAGFHNPAGFGAIGKANVIANFSPVIGSLRSSPTFYTGGPNAGEPLNLTSDKTFAPFFLLGGAVRVWEYLSFGVTVFPVASAGAEYNYRTDPDDPDTATRDYTKLVFLEIAPGFAFNYDKWGLRLGMTWRINTVSLDRERTGASPIDLHVGGASLAGVRIGAQWDLPWVEGLSLGLHYRSKVKIGADMSDPSSALGLPLTAARQDWTLPSRLSFGASHKVGTMRVSADAEYGFQSQNERGDVTVEADALAAPFTLPNVYAWKNQWTLRGGVEYGVYQDRIPVRVGFIWDQRTSNPSYPSAFGAPPAANYTMTMGSGYRVDGHRVNFAFVYRWGKGEVLPDQVTNPVPSYGTCSFCAQAGTYVIKMAGLYLDYSYDF